MGKSDCSKPTCLPAGRQKKVILITQKSSSFLHGNSFSSFIRRLSVSASVSASTSISFIHSYLAAIKSGSIKAFHHFCSGRFIYFYPGIHFPKVNSPQNFFFQVAFIQDVLKKAGFVKTILCTQVYK